MCLQHNSTIGKWIHDPAFDFRPLALKRLKKRKY